MLTEPERLKALVITLALAPAAQGLSSVLHELIMNLHPELHGLEWVASLGGTVSGQILFPALGWRRLLGGLLVGYMTGVYAGEQITLYFSWKSVTLGCFLVAMTADFCFRGIYRIAQNPKKAWRDAKLVIDDIIVRAKDVAGILSSMPSDVVKQLIDAIKGRK